MGIESGDILYAMLVFGTAIVGYRVTRSLTMSLLSKIITVGIGLVILLDFHGKYGWKLDTAHDWLWRVITPDRALIVGILLGLALVLRDRYAPMLSEAGFMVQRMKTEAEADLARQRREIEADISRQHREAGAQAERESHATKERLEKDIRDAKERLAREQENIRREQEKASKERNRTEYGDPYKILGVSGDATPAEIKKRYRELMTQYHPDKAVGATPEIRKLAEERVKEINWAYEQVEQ